MRKIVILLIFLLLPLLSFSHERVGSESIELGVYNPCPDPSCNPSSELSKVKGTGANSILVKLVDDEGYALYPSKFLPVREDMVDVTIKTIEEAKRLGMKVYGWINIPHEIWLRDHPNWIAVLSNGRPSDFYGRDYFHRIVPPSRIIRERECTGLLKSIAKEISSLGLDGIDINDNFQFSDTYLPSKDEVLLTSYDKFTVKAFERDTGVRVEGSSPVEWASYIRDHEGIWNKWISWRAEQVTELIRIITAAAREVKPNIEIRPHLLIWDPLEAYGLDFAEISSVTGTLYVMIPSSESRMRHYRAVWSAKQVAPRVIASTYLPDLPKMTAEEAKRRALWIASAGADGIYVYWEGTGKERYTLMKAIFDEFREVKMYRTPNWLRGARIVSVYADSPDQLNLDRFRDQGVSLIELDVGLSSCERLYGAGISDALRVVRTAVQRAHSLGMRVVVYVPALEVICHRRMHLNWTQESLDGRKLVIRGSELNVPWLSEDEIDLWMSPFSPHRKIVLDRVRRILDAGADGIWLDAPHLPEYLTDEMSDLWPDTSKWGSSNFEEEYWEQTPHSVEDPSFSTWLRWRHDAALDFILSIAEEIHFKGKVLMVESSACDAGGTEMGFDQIFLRFNPLVILVPEVDPPSWEKGFSNASMREWSSFYAILKQARGSSPSASMIPLTYGRDGLDSAKQLGLIIAIADGFFETNSENELMTGTVGEEFRKKAFWLVDKLARINRTGRSDVAVLFSSFSRDLADTYVPGPYNVSGTRHMRAFRRTIRVLVENHIDFNVIPIERATLDELNGYKVVIAPDLEVLTHEGRELLSQYRGKLLVIGKFGSMDERGEPTPELNAGTRIRMENLPKFLSPMVDVPKGLLSESFGDGCKVLSLVNVGGVEGTIKLPRGWSLYFDDLEAEPVKARARVPKTFLLLMSGDDGGESRPSAANFIASPEDKKMNKDLIDKLSSPFSKSGVAIMLGGPGVNRKWIGLDNVKFIREGMTYTALMIGNNVYHAKYGREDYAIIVRTKCGELSFYQVAGITRYGTRAALIWLLERGVDRDLTLIRWKDNGDGIIEPMEVTSQNFGER